MPNSSSSKNPLSNLATSLRELRQRHRERHRPTGFGFVFGDRVDYLDPARWDAVTGGNSLFLRREVLRVIEEHGPGNLEPRYAIIFRNEKPVAAIAVQVVTVTGDRLRREKSESAGARAARLLQRVLAPAARQATAKMRERLLVAGNLLSWGFHGIAFAPDETPAELWPAVAEALYRIRRAERLGGQTNLVLVKDLTARQTGLQALRRFSYPLLAPAFIFFLVKTKRQKT